MTTKTQRLINRIEEKESFYDIAYLCEDFATFIDEISEWGVDHIGGVDFDDPEVNVPMMNAFLPHSVVHLTTHTPQGGMLNASLYC